MRYGETRFGWNLMCELLEYNLLNLQWREDDDGGGGRLCDDD